MENIKDCFKHRGHWDRVYKLCYEQDKLADFNCTFLYKGLKGCWGINDTAAIFGIDNKQIYEFEQDFMRQPAATVIDFLSDLKTAIESHDDFIFHDVTKNSVWRCYNEKGKVISCKEKNAILSNSPKNVVCGIRNLRKIKPLHDVAKMDEELSKDAEKKAYEKFVHEMFAKASGPEQYHFSDFSPGKIYSGGSGKKRRFDERKKRGKKS